jgi:segregation and condensation protein B
MEAHNGQHADREETPNAEGSVPVQGPDAAEDEGLSLDQLSEKYAELIGGRRQRVPTSDDPAAAADEEEATAPDELPLEEDADPGDVSPRSILEAMLFVGHPGNQPLTSKQAAALMRGVEPGEIDGLVRELNEIYAEEGCPYTIVSVGAGYRVRLRDEFARLRQKFRGRIREVRLSQAAIDVLAIVGYNQPVTREQVDKLREKPSSGILRLLVRRQLLRIDRRQDKPGVSYFHTTDRFLNLFGLETLADLPRSQELERG